MFRLLRDTVLCLTLPLVTAVGVYLALPDASSEAEHLYERIRPGMTRQELESLLGRGEDVTRKMMVTHYIGGRDIPVVTGEQVFLWKDGYTEIWIGFTADRVVSKWFRDLNYL